MAAKKAKAEKPKRGWGGRGSIWSGALSFGLLNIPVSLQSAEQEKELHFKQLDKRNFAPVKMKRVSSADGKEVAYKDIVKGFETEPGKYVIVTDEDFRAANPKATQTVEIEDFVPLAEIDPMLFEKPYYVVPQEQGAKGYYLLRDALARSEKVAIAKVVLRTKQHLCAVMPRGKYLVLELLRFSHEVLEEHEAKYLKGVKEASYSARELKMAEDLIREMTATWKPDKYEDTYYDELKERIEKRAKAGEVNEVPKAARKHAEEEEETGGGVVDLLPLLKKSLAEKGRHKSA